MHTVKKLPNGITLLTVPVKGTMATTVLAMFPVGSRYETHKLSGASHFVEHMLFKGTDKRPTSLDISRALEAYGAEFNAFTNKDYTGYYIKIDGKQQELAFDLLSDMIYHSKIEEAEVEKEKGAIVEELRMYKDNPLMAVDQLFDSILYGECPMGWDVGGTPETVRALSRLDLWNYYQTHYSPKNMVLVVAGAISPKLGSFINYFSKKRAPAVAKGPAFYKTHFQKIVWPKNPGPLDHRVIVEKRVADQAQVILGFPSFKYSDPLRSAQTLLLSILGSGMSSRLFVEVREKRGLAYSVHAGSALYRDAGVAYVQAGLDPARLHEAFVVIKRELARLVEEPVTKEELSEAKTSIAGAMALGLENSRAQADWYSKQFIFGRRIETPDDALKRLNRVTAKDIQKVAALVFKLDQMRAAVIGPLTKQEVLEALN